MPAAKGRLICCDSWPYLRGYALRNAPRIRPFSLGFHDKFHFETVSYGVAKFSATLPRSLTKGVVTILLSTVRSSSMPNALFMKISGM
jgi:hypothetical protein